METFAGRFHRTRCRTADDLATIFSFFFSFYPIRTEAFDLVTLRVMLIYRYFNSRSRTIALISTNCRSYLIFFGNKTCLIFHPLQDRFHAGVRSHNLWINYLTWMSFRKWISFAGVHSVWHVESWPQNPSAHAVMWPHVTACDRVTTWQVNLSSDIPRMFIFYPIISSRWDSTITNGSKVKYQKSILILQV